jgi:predicted AAA+ superfamily ATPase
MLAHHHAQIWNGAELARAFGMSESSVRRYLDTLVSSFVVRTMTPWHENIGKRQVKAPRVYLADPGMLHALLDIRDARALLAHPKVGASWEGFALDVVTRTLGAEPRECFFWRTHQGAELDLLVVRGGRRLGFEFKRTDSPALTPSMRSALADLRLDSLTVVHAGRHEFSLAPRVRAVPLPELARALAPLR